MSVSRLSRTVLCVSVLGGAAVAASASAAAGPPSPVTASRIARPPHTLAPGTPVRSADLGERVFPTASHGFALASVGQAQYPAATTNGGRTWRTDGPALHLDAAQAPLAVTDIGADSARTAYAYGSGSVIDTTSDGGRQWYRAVFEGLPMAVVPGIDGHLVAFIDGSTGSSASSDVTWQYVSSNGGRSWRYDSAIGGL